jgi:Kdo2-lipid IVA lauroyltransferase/acyltransferase
MHWLEYVLVLKARAFDRLLGPRLAGGIAAAMGRLAYRPLGIRRAVVEDQLRRAFPHRDDAWIQRTARAAYEHLGREGMMLLRLSRLGREDVLAATEVHGLDRLEAAVAAGTGAVLVTGHFGNWEIGGASVAARGVPLDVVAQRQANPHFDGLINRARERLGMTVIRRGGATKGALRSLRAGRVVALVADQDARRSGVFVPFFGRPASTHRGPAVLALRSGAPVFMGTAVRRDDGGYRVTIRPVPVPGPDTGEADERAGRLTAELAAALESAVREEPGQYLWHHRRWKTRPRNGDGSPPVSTAGTKRDE